MDRPFFFYYLNVYVIYLEFELTDFLLIFNMKIKKHLYFYGKRIYCFLFNFQLGQLSNTMTVIIQFFNESKKIIIIRGMNKMIQLSSNCEFLIFLNISKIRIPPSSQIFDHLPQNTMFFNVDSLSRFSQLCPTIKGKESDGVAYLLCINLSGRNSWLFVPRHRRFLNRQRHGEFSCQVRRSYINICRDNAL